MQQAQCNSCPRSSKQAGQVHLFQRSANWVLPKLDDPFSPEDLEARRRDVNLALAIRQEIFNAVDSGQTFANLEVNAEREAAVIAAIGSSKTQRYAPNSSPRTPTDASARWCSNNYYSAFNRPNLELVTDPIDRITSDAIVTADGRERRVDTLIIATGFAATRYLSAIDVVGRDGRHISEAWNDGAIAYLGVTTAGFPNLFMLYGPNTNNGSILSMIEYQVGYVMRPAGAARHRGTGLDRRASRRDALLQRGGAARHRGRLGLAGRLQRLLPHAQRPRRHAMAVLHDRVRQRSAAVDPAPSSSPASPTIGD